MNRKGSQVTVRARKFSSSLLAVLMLAVGMVAVSPSPAEAATPTCNTTVNVKPRAGYSYYMIIPKASAANTLNCLMQQGATGPEVTALQTAIAYCFNVPESFGGPNFSSGDIDGVYGGKTAYALAGVQRILLLDDDGVYGAHTAASMKFPWHNPSNDSILSTCTWREGSN